MDWFCILPEKRIVDDSIFSWVAGFEEAVSTEFFDYEKENSGIENPTKCLKTEAGNTDVKKPLAPANRFEGMTTSDQFSHFLRGLCSRSQHRVGQQEFRGMGWLANRSKSRRSSAK